MNITKYHLKPCIKSLLVALFLIMTTRIYAFGYNIHEIFANEYIVIANGEYIKFDVPPYVEDGRVLVPIRSIAESFDMKIDWEQVSKKVTISDDSNNIELIINSTESIVNGAIVQMDVPARIVNGRTMLPLRFVGESLGKNVYYDSAFLFGGEWGFKKTIWILDYNLLEEEDYGQAELDKNYYLADSQEHGTQYPYLLREGAITRRGIKLGDSLDIIKEKYGIPGFEFFNNGKLVLRYYSKFIPQTDSGYTMSFYFSEGRLVELFLVGD